MDVAELGYKIDSRQLSEGTRALDKHTAAATRTEKATDKLERSVNQLGKRMGIGFGVALVAGLGLIIKNTMEAEKVQAQLASRLKDTGRIAGRTIGQLNDSADALQRLTTFDDEAIGSVQAMLLTFKNIRGDIFDEATASVLDLATAMGTDANSAALQLGKALNDPLKGIAALGRAGVQFSDAQKKVIEGLVQTGKVAEAQRIVLKEVEGQMGSAAEAARNTLAGSLRGLKNDFDNLLEGDGKGVQGTADAINDLAETMRSPEVKKGFATIVDGVFDVMNAVVGAIPKIIEFNNELSKAAGIGTQGGKLRKGNAIDFFAGYADVITGASGNRKEALRRASGGMFGTGVANFTNVTSEKADFSNVLGSPLPESTEPYNVSLGDTADKAEKADGAVRKLAKALRDMSDIQREWTTELGGTGNPIMDDYAQRLDTIREKAEDFAASGVPTEKIAAFTAEMTKLAESIRDKEIVEFLEEFDLQTRALAASMANDGSSALVAYESAVRELNKEMQAGILTQELYHQRMQALAMQRDSGPVGVLRSLNLEIEALGKSALWIAKRNALIDAGITAESEWAPAILDTTTALFEQAEAMKREVETMDAIRDAGKGFIVDLGNGVKPLDAIGNALDRIYQKMLDMVAEDFMNKIFGKQGEAAGGSTGGWFGALFSAFTSGGSGSGFDSVSAAAQSSGDFGAFNPNMGSGMALGGTMRGDLVHQVGERNRPELAYIGGKQYMIPGDRGRVEPIDGSGGATTINVTQTFQSQGRIDRQTASQMQQDAARKLSVATARNK